MLRWYVDNWDYLQQVRVGQGEDGRERGTEE